MNTPKNINFAIWQLLDRSFSAVKKVRRAELNQYGITLRQSAVLRVIIRLGVAATPTEISKQLILKLNTISGQLQRMETDGLIRKVQDPGQKKKIRVEITSKGYDLFQQLTNQKSIDHVMSVLTEKEKIQLWSILAKVREQALKTADIQTSNLFPPSDYTNLSNSA